MKIALLGSIPKGDSERWGWADWKPEFINAITHHVADAVFLNGDAVSDALGPSLVVGHDLSMVKEADCVVVDATSKIGAGTAQEMVIAKLFAKPVISVVPQDSHYHKSEVTFHGQLVKNWIHPFISVSSDFVANSPEDAGRWIARYLGDPNFKAKDMSVFRECIEEFDRLHIVTK